MWGGERKAGKEGGIKSVGDRKGGKDRREKNARKDKWKRLTGCRKEIT